MSSYHSAPSIPSLSHPMFSSLPLLIGQSYLSGCLQVCGLFYSDSCGLEWPSFWWEKRASFFHGSLDVYWTVGFRWSVCCPLWSLPLLSQLKHLSLSYRTLLHQYFCHGPSKMNFCVIIYTENWMVGSTVYQRVQQKYMSNKYFRLCHSDPTSCQRDCPFWPITLDWWGHFWREHSVSRSINLQRSEWYGKYQGRVHLFENCCFRVFEPHSVFRSLQIPSKYRRSCW